MGRQASEALLGIHVNQPAVVPAEVWRGSRRAPPPEDMSYEERAAFEALCHRTFLLRHPGLAAWPYEGDAWKTKEEALNDMTRNRIANMGKSTGHLYSKNHRLPVVVA
jgi:hypothetical protein